MSLLTLAQVDGVTVFVASNQVVAIRQDAANPTTRCYVTMQGIETPVYVASFWATLVVAIDAELSNQYIGILASGEQVSFSLNYIYQLRPDPSAPLSRTMVVMGAQGTPFMVAALASVLAAAINAYDAFGIPTVSGTWTPTATLVTNLDAVVPAVSHYIRVGDEVSFSASGTFDPTAAAPTNFGLSLPIASNFAATQNAVGVGVSQVYAPGFVQADITNDRLDVYITSSGTASIKWTVTGTYRVL